MYNFGVFVVFAYCLVHTAFSKCKDEDFGKIKDICQRSGLKLDMAEAAENGTLVCDCLKRLFRCIEKHVPNCIETIAEQYVVFRHTPWDCHMTEHHDKRNNKCGDDVIFKVRFKKEQGQTVVVHSDDDNDIQGSSASCKLNQSFITIYLILLCPCLLKRIIL